MNELAHAKEFQWWRTNRRSVKATAQHFGKSRNTITKWRDAEDWEAHAQQYDAQDAQEVAVESAKAITSHLVDGKEAIERARRNHYNLQQMIILVGNLINNALQNEVNTKGNKKLVDVAKFLENLNAKQLAALVRADAQIAAVLYPALIPQHIEISGSVTAPNQLVDNDIQALGETVDDLVVIEAEAQVVEEDAPDEAG